MPNQTLNSPFEKFESWLKEAQKKESSYPEAFSLSTLGEDSFPTSRTVLLKLHDRKKFTFFTNYNSKKSTDLFKHPKAHILFYWKETQKQIRIKGTIQKASKEVSDKYWEGRPLDSRLNTVLSQQSQSIPEGFDYKKAFDELKAQHPESIARPEHWGGLEITPNHFEFWEEGEFRWHKREVYSLTEGSVWQSDKLFP